MKSLLKYFLIIYFILLIIMTTSWSIWHITEGGTLINNTISEGLIEFAQFPSTAFHYLKSHIYNNPRKILDTKSKDGFTYYVDSSKLSNSYFLISTFTKENDLEIKLLDVKNNVVIKSWYLKTDDIIKYEPSNIQKSDIRLGHPYLLKDSSIIVSWGSLIKINKSSKIVWVNKFPFDHSIESENDSTIWVCANFPRNKNQGNQIDNYLISINSNNGEIIYKKSLIDLLIENGYTYLLEIGHYHYDPIHLNDIQPALKDSKYWKKGDLLISIRDRNTVFLFRPSTNKITWLKTGPWFKQHDCDFVNENEIMIFGNDAIDMLKNNEPSLKSYNHNNIYLYNFENSTIDTPYSRILNKLQIQTLTQGRCDILPNGDMFIDDTNAGKLYILNKDSLKLTYIDRFDEKYIKLLNWVRVVNK